MCREAQYGVHELESLWQCLTENSSREVSWHVWHVWHVRAPPSDPQCLARRCGGFRLFQQASNLSGLSSQTDEKSGAMFLRLFHLFCGYMLHVYACHCMSQAHSIWPIVYLLLLIHTTPRHGSKSLKVCIAALPHCSQFGHWIFWPCRDIETTRFWIWMFFPAIFVAVDRTSSFRETWEVEKLSCKFAARYLTQQYTICGIP